LASAKASSFRAAEECELLYQPQRLDCMKHRFGFALLFTLNATALLAQSPAPAADQAIAAAMKEVQTQQAQIAENQGKIDEKLAVLAEAVRVARIYSSRGGH
jgi:hypothetical protein